MRDDAFEDPVEDAAVRPHDPLVEPLFGGLGIERDVAPAARPERRPVRRAVERLAAVFRRRRAGRDPG